MRRILFRWRGYVVWSYPAMLYLGLVAGVLVGNLAAHVTGVNALRVFAATLILIPPAIAGARLLYVAEHWERYRASPRRIWNRQEGGMAMYGGMPVMLLFSVPVVAAAGIGLGAFWDVASLTIVTGMVFAKIGCWLNGCCARGGTRGGSGAWAHIPAQLIEAGWAAVVLAIAGALLGRLSFPGELFLAVTAIHGAGRLMLISMRQPDLGSNSKGETECPTI
jgi:phosphatidylglycerol---prolipoprotein diacylglyceryl transferase